MSDRTMINAFGADDFGRLAADEQALVARRQKLLGPAYRLFYERPLHFVRGEGVWLYDAAGKAYLDAYNNVAAVGHANLEVAAAIGRQAGLLNTHTRYIHDGILDYAEALTATLPAELNQMMFTCTGSEANDLAMRVAKYRTGGEGIIVTSLAYHGVTSAVAAFSPSLGANVPLGPAVRTVRPPDAYRADGEDLGERLGRDVAAAIADLLRHGIKPALLIVDTIFSSDGVFAAPAGILKPAVEAIRAAGGLFIADEVQPGFGRTGEAFWGFARHDVVPDIVTIGKPMGNGYPIAGMIARPEVLEKFGRDIRYFNTFGGTPVGIAAAQAVLDIVRRDGLQENARVVGEALRAGIGALAAGYPAIGEVRGAGLFVGVEVVSDREAKTPDAVLTGRIVNRMRERGVLISASGPAANVLKIRPPLVFSLANAELFLATLGEVLAAV
jgi:4-aminobutyrate aminotransferase-like enzyme